MLFADIIGHKEIQEHLRGMVNAGRVSHAMLFTSNTGVGALPMAMAFAQYVMCRGRSETDACGVCGDCYKMQLLEHPDCHYIFPVNNSKLARSTGRSDEKPTSDQFVHLWREAMAETGGYIDEKQWCRKIGLENQQGNINKSEANELLRKMSFKSFGGGYKIAIIWLPERMHEAAANTLLKLIEEPAPQTLFLFVSEDPNRIIGTIRSRTQLVNVPDLEENVILQSLVQIQGLSSQDAGAIAHSSQGSWAKALELAVNGESSDDEDYAGFVELMRLSYTGKFLDLFEWAAQMASMGREAQKRFCVNSIALTRDCYMLNIGMPEITYLQPEREKFCRNFAPYVNHASAEQLVAEFELLLRQVVRNGNPKILFTHFALSISKVISNAKSHAVAGE